MTQLVSLLIPIYATVRRNLYESPPIFPILSNYSNVTLSSSCRVCRECETPDCKDCRSLSECVATIALMIYNLDESKRLPNRHHLCCAN